MPLTKFNIDLVLLSGGENEIAREKMSITVGAEETSDDAVGRSIRSYFADLDWELTVGDVIRIEAGDVKTHKHFYGEDA